MTFWPFKRRGDANKSSSPSQARELRIATSGSFSIKALIEMLRVDGAGSYSQPARVRAALFTPGAATTLQFHADHNKKPGSCARASCVHALQMLTPAETSDVLDDVKRIGASIGWSDRGVSLPTQDVLVQNLSKESQELVHRAIREQLLPFARRHYPHLNAAFDKQPYPRPGNLFVVRYCASSQRPGGFAACSLRCGPGSLRAVPRAPAAPGDRPSPSFRRCDRRGLKLHKDETALTFNLCLSPEDGFTGGGTYFPANSADVDGILLRPKPGCCLIHDGNIKHAGNEVVSGQRFILVGFYNADGRDRAGEEQYFSKKALEEQRARNKVPTAQPVQTIYFTTAVASVRGNSPVVGMPATQIPASLVPTGSSMEGGADSEPLPRFGENSSVAIQGPLGVGEPPDSAAVFTPISAADSNTAFSERGENLAQPERPLLFAQAAASGGASFCTPVETVSARGKELHRRHKQPQA
eukprot:Transcript_30634.p1 GENE.Transcript_30634~~Transcript_30634.p1  ORF type:complete len:469 (-),score=106.64 Transcript_30634:227-1633(-)